MLPIVIMQPAELVVFAHGMANFGHNRGTNAEQERLLRDRLSGSHDLLGVFDDSGNYAFVSSLGAGSLGADVLDALRVEYRVSGVVVVSRAMCAAGLEELEQSARATYGDRFHDDDYAVELASGRWRLGLVFMDPGEIVGPKSSKRLRRHDDESVKVLTVRGYMVGVLKFDQGKRIPWGVPAGVVEQILRGTHPKLLATGRSAKTVRGVLRLFADAPHSGSQPVARPRIAKKEEKPTTMRTSSSESFDALRRWLQKHPELKKAGTEMHSAFIDLARKVWEGSNGQIVPRQAGNRSKHVPFSRLGTQGNLADPRIRRGGIRLALKIPTGALQSVDPHGRTVPIQKKGRWKPYRQEFDFRDPKDIEFACRLVIECDPELAS